MNGSAPQDSHLFPLNSLRMLPPESSSLTSTTSSPPPLPFAPLPQIHSSSVSRQKQKKTSLLKLNCMPVARYGRMEFQRRESSLAMAFL